jgi:hypothetical protein
VPQGLVDESDVVLSGCKDGSRVLQAWQSVIDSRRPGDSPAFAFRRSGCGQNGLLSRSTERLREPGEHRQIGAGSGSLREGGGGVALDGEALPTSLPTVLLGSRGRITRLTPYVLRKLIEFRSAPLHR